MGKLRRLHSFKYIQQEDGSYKKYQKVLRGTMSTWVLIEVQNYPPVQRNGETAVIEKPYSPRAGRYNLTDAAKTKFYTLLEYGCTLKQAARAVNISEKAAWQMKRRHFRKYLESAV